MAGLWETIKAQEKAERAASRGAEAGEPVPNGALASVAAYTETSLASGRGAEAQSFRGMEVSASYFATLGVRPLIGRFFLPDEDGDPVAPNVAVISYGFWQRHFNGSPSAVGDTLLLGDLRYVIVGVAPSRFSGVSTSPVDVWVPLTAGATPQPIFNQPQPEPPAEVPEDQVEAPAQEIPDQAVPTQDQQQQQQTPDGQQQPKTPEQLLEEQPLARARIQSHQRVSEQAGAFAIATIEIDGGRSQRQK